MTGEELRQLIASNARAIEAAAEERTELRRAVLNLEQIVEKLTEIQGGVSNLLARIDEDRPTILRKLNSLENKIDQLLQQQNGEDS